jgi:Holliday junction resolvase RusA-like endonuclease
MRFILPGPPVPKQRHRIRIRGKRVISFDPQEAIKLATRNELIRQFDNAINSKNKETVIEASSIACGKLFSVKLSFHLPICNSSTETQKNAKLWGFELANKKPDLDNMEKFYLDAANGVIFSDDSQVIELSSSKHYALIPHTVIDIMPIKELNMDSKAIGILNIFSPQKLKEFENDVSSLATNVHCPKMSEINTDDREVWIKSTACVLSEFADKYSSDLAKITKKYRGYHANGEQ